MQMYKFVNMVYKKYIYKCWHNAHGIHLSDIARGRSANEQDSSFIICFFTPSLGIMCYLNPSAFHQIQNPKKLKRPLLKNRKF